MVAFTGHQKIDNVGEDPSQKQFTPACFLFVGELENTVTKLTVINFVNRCIQRLWKPAERHLLSLGVLGKSYKCAIFVTNLVNYIELCSLSSF